MAYMKSEISKGENFSKNLDFFWQVLGIEECMIKFSDLEIISKIAGGSTCEVFHGEYKGLDVGKLQFLD